MEGDRVENVLDVVCAVLEQHDLDDARVSVPHHPGRRDLSLFGLARVSADQAESALREVDALDAIGSVSNGKREKVGIRLSEQCVKELGEMLESGNDEPVSTGDLSPGRQVVVDFCDPNATGALHMGHLRNIAIGNAIASIMRACGATVATQAQVGDVGRSVGEAMAGYEQYGGGAGPSERGQKSDHFVGACYSSYVRAVAEEGRTPEGLAGDPALSREDEERDDLAGDLIERWREGDPEVVALWRKVRDWAVEGHEATLSRLDVRMDRLLFESEFLADVEAAGDRLVEAGVAEVAPSGAVVAGDSTRYLRYLGLWDATRSLTGEGESIQVMGEEWLSLAEANDRLLGCLAEAGDIHPSERLVHGMVAVEDQVVKSSLATPWFVDELLDETVAHPEVERISEGDPRLAERIAGMTVLGMFIADSPEKRIAISREGLFDSVANPGWAMALATERAWDSRYDGVPDPSVADRDYRFLIAQSQVHRQLARRSAEELNPVHLARFHGHLCQWFLRTPCTPRLARTMRTVTASGIASLGLPPPRHVPAASQAA